MKEYFFLKGKEQNGPFTIDQLFDKGLTYETFVWTEGMENWRKLRDIPELVQVLKPNSVPPPPPTETDEKIFKTEVTGQLKVTTEKKTNTTFEAIKPSRQNLTWIIAWCGFHLFALLMSYSQIEIFNKYRTRESDAFWPIVEFLDCEERIAWEKQIENQPTVGHVVGEDCYFKGLFVNYDWTEFAFYVGGAIIVFLLVRISNNQEGNKKNVT
jgi:hypothetical protein